MKFTMARDETLLEKLIMSTSPFKTLVFGLLVLMIFAGVSTL